jgi:hypothetical protein
MHLGTTLPKPSRSGPQCDQSQGPHGDQRSAPRPRRAGPAFTIPAVAIKPSEFPAQRRCRERLPGWEVTGRPVRRDRRAERSPQVAVGETLTRQAVRPVPSVCTCRPPSDNPGGVRLSAAHRCARSASTAGLSIGLPFLFGSGNRQLLLSSLAQRGPQNTDGSGSRVWQS